MGLIDISTKNTTEEGDEASVYLSFKTHEDRIELLILVCRPNKSSELLGTNLSKDTSVIKKWSQNLQLSSENYLEQLQICLQKKSLENGDENHLAGNNTSVSEKGQENFFELFSQSLVWRQYFPDKKMYGRKGKFTLDKIENADILRLVMKNVITDFRTKDVTIQHLKEDNKKLIEEKEELQRIAEKSVKMKEELEKELYAKFAILLNAKKKKLAEFRRQLLETGGQLDTSQSTQEDRQTSSSKEVVQDPQPSGSGGSCIAPTGERQNSGGEYGDDTDVDSPQEVDSDEDWNKNVSFKRKGIVSSLRSKISDKRSKFLESDESPDMFNESLEMELNMASSGSRFKKKDN